jgi:two-component system nitrogen regulation response regulator NtrX
MSSYRILIVDDDEFVVEDIATSLDAARFTVNKAYDLDLAIETFQLWHPHIVITDLQMKKSRDDGLILLEKIKAISPTTAVIIITSHSELDRAVAAMQAGAADFITKPFEMTHLLARIDKVAQRVKLQEENERLRSEILTKHRIIGESAPIQELKKQIAMVARSNSRVLVTGPNGSGKELVARSIHNQSQRFEKPFLAINCAAIPENLFESELFGTSRGAFTGAIDKKGAFELADGGTLFLDEIGDMSLINQGKVLRVLQENEIRRVGNIKSIAVDVRVIAATNKNLESEIQANRFREDLYYRLNVARIATPPLSECREDIPHIINRALELMGRENRFDRYFLPDAVNYLKSLSWPGNTRQLINLIESLMIFWCGEPMDIESVKTRMTISSGKNALVIETDKTLKDAVNNFEHEYILKVIKECRDNITEAAGRLDLQRPYLYEKMKKLGIDRNGM